MFYKISLIALLSIGAPLALAENAGQTGLSALAKDSAALSQKQQSLETGNRTIATLRAQQITAKNTLGLADIKIRESRSNLEKMQKIESENPGLVGDEKLRNAERLNIKARTDFETAKNTLVRIDGELAAAQEQAAILAAELQPMQLSFENHLNSYVERQVTAKVAALQIPKTVTAKGSAVCGEDVSVKACKEKSKADAMAIATEQGGVIDFSSVTEIKNFQLSKEEIRGEVRATLANWKVVAVVKTGENAFETNVSVDVTPVVQLKLRRIIADTLRQDVCAEIGCPANLNQSSAPAEVQQPEPASPVAMSVEDQLERQAEEGRKDSAKHNSERSEIATDEKWNWKINAGMGSNQYSAAFTNGAFNGKTASANYMNINMMLVGKVAGYIAEISVAQGSGKHNLYAPAAEQNFNRFEAAASLGMSTDSLPNLKYFLSGKMSNTQLTAFGQSWTKDTFATTGVGGGIELLLPVTIGTFGIQLDGGIKSATWSDDSGYSATSDTALGGSGKIHYTYSFNQWLGMTADAGLQYYDFKFKSFAVKESVSAVGVGVVARF